MGQGHTLNEKSEFSMHDRKLIDYEQQRRNIDRSWMKASHMSDEYENGFEQFLQFTQLNAESLGGKFFCPCVKCVNGRRQTVNEIKSHLICHDIILNYTKWIWHRELSNILTIFCTEAVHEDTRDRIEDMIRDLGQDTFEQAHTPLYENIERDSKMPLYSRCTTFTRLSTVLALVNLKARFGWSDKSFTKLLVLLKNTLPKNQYEMKKILCLVGMEYQKIHACPNDCILYRNQFAEIRHCPTCGVSRYKVQHDEFSDDAITKNSRPTKVFWYLLKIPRFK